MDPEDGSVVIESVFAILFLLVLVLGTVQIVFTTYSRNAVRAAAHEGVRSAVERGATTSGAISAARVSVTRTAGGLVRDLDVAVSRIPIHQGSLMKVTVRARLRSLGPLPFNIPVTAVAHAVNVGDPR